MRRQVGEGEAARELVVRAEDLVADAHVDGATAATPASTSTFAGAGARPATSSFSDHTFTFSFRPRTSSYAT
jgi:hypothetical protein